MRTSQSFGAHFTIKKETAKTGIASVYTVITINKDEKTDAEAKAADCQNGIVVEL